jgi:hypothetical protein
MEQFMELENNEAERELPQILEICRAEGLVLAGDHKTPEEIFEEITKLF